MLLDIGKGYKTQVSDADYDAIKKDKWRCERSGNSLSVIKLSREVIAPNKRIYRRVYLSRFLLQCPKGLVVDHINGDRLDNRRENLRICTGAQNSKNRRKASNNTSGYKGVYFRKNWKNRVNKKKRWTAIIIVDQKRINLGDYLTAEEGGKAYDRAAKRYFGEFAKLNFPTP